VYGFVAQRDNAGAPAGTLPGTAPENSGIPQPIDQSTKGVRIVIDKFLTQDETAANLTQVKSPSLSLSLYIYI
jgi:hypothetical protein